MERDWASVELPFAATGFMSWQDINGTGCFNRGIMIKKEIHDWLVERRVHFTREFRQVDGRGGGTIKFWFAEKQDALLFKLTWGGQ